MAKRRNKKILTIILSVLLGIGIISACVFAFKTDDTKRIKPNFSVGSIDSSGKYVESDDSIYSDLFECQGLKVELDFDSNAKYSVYFYRFDQSFVNSVVDQTDIYELPLSDVVKYARIVITPNFDNETIEEHKIRFWEIHGIAKLVKITVNADQVENVNLAEFEEDGSWDDINDKDWQKLVAIDVSKIDKLALVFESGLDNVFSSVKYVFGTDGPVGRSIELDKDSKHSSNICLIDVSNKTNNIYISIKSDVKLKIYKYA